MLVGLGARRDAELEVMHPLLQVLDAIVRLVVVVSAFAVDRAKVAAADRTLHLKLGALQVVVVTLMLCQDSVTATIRTLDKLFGAFA